MMPKLKRVADARLSEIKDELARDIPTRLRAIMVAFGIKSQPQFAALIGGGDSNIGNMLMGAHVPKVEKMILLCEQAPGLTLDWIYTGATDGMLPELANYLTQIIKDKVEAC